MSISNKRMADYWTKRVKELEAMRPITASEAIVEAERLEASAAERDAAVAAAEQSPRETGYVADGDTVAARGMRNNAALGAARKAVWGETTRALQERGRAKALRTIASQAEGVVLAESLAEARARAKYYSDLAAKE